MPRACFLFLLAAIAWAEPKSITLPGKSPIINFRIVLNAGSAQDPADKPGLANLTAAILAQSGTKALTYKQVVDALYPMAASLGSQTDKEMTTFAGATHVDNLEAYYKLLKQMLLEPGWRAEDFQRVKEETINALRIGLRANNDEELGKEVLYEVLYRGTPYEHYSMGSLTALERITLDDVKGFYARHYTQANITLGLAGGFPAGFAERLKKDFAVLPTGTAEPVKAVKPATISHTRAVIVEKKTRSVAYSFGFPIDVKRGDPDFPALLLMTAYFGPHRNGGHLYDRIREVRGLNYGDYAYVEYFPRGMFTQEVAPNLSRRSQSFQVWIRPVEPTTAAFTLRTAFFELNKLIREGISEEAFDRSRQFLIKNVDVLTKTKNAELGYAIDSAWYGIPNYNSYLKAALAKITREQVNAAIRKHLRADRVQIVAISDHAAELKAQLVGTGPTPIVYSSPKPAALLEEDKIIERHDIGLRAEDIEVVPLDKIFE